MLWVDPLVLPYVAAIGAVLVGFCRRELWGAAGALLGAAAALGAAPLLLHSLLTGRNPLHAVLAAGGANASAGWADRLHGGLVLGPPLGMGFCSPGGAPPGSCGGRSSCRCCWSSSASPPGGPCAPPTLALSPPARCRPRWWRRSGWRSCSPRWPLSARTQ